MPELGPVRVLVVGEVILDRYLHGDVSRISPEAPIPILRVTRREEKPGNAGFVMANLRALGAEVSAASVVGGDRDGQLLRDIFGGLGIGMRAMLTDPGRPTTVKSRLLGSVQSANRATQQLLRVDEEDSLPLAPALERELIARIEARAAARSWRADLGHQQGAADAESAARDHRWRAQKKNSGDRRSARDRGFFDLSAARPRLRPIASRPRPPPASR